MVVFGAIIELHSYGLPNYSSPYYKQVQVWEPYQRKPWEETYIGKTNPYSDILPKGHYRTESVFIHGYWWGHRYWEKDVRMPLFVLAVFYTGLFFILGDKRPPRDSK
jgi:hypothetical protein